MTVKEILKNRETYSNLLNTLKYNPDSLDDATYKKLKDIEDMFQDKYVLKYRNNQTLILKMFIKDNMTIEEIADEMNISTRHVDRLKKQAIETISDVLEPLYPRASTTNERG